jgi:hypothetical protein
MDKKTIWVTIDVMNHNEGSKAFRNYGAKSYYIKGCSEDEPHKYAMGTDDVKLHEDLCKLSTEDGIPFQFWSPKGQIGTEPKVLIGARGVYFGLLPKGGVDSQATRRKSIADKLATLKENRPAIAIN